MSTKVQNEVQRIKGRQTANERYIAFTQNVQLDSNIKIQSATAHDVDDSDLDSEIDGDTTNANNNNNNNNNNNESNNDKPSKKKAKLVRKATLQDTMSMKKAYFEYEKQKKSWAQMKELVKQYDDTNSGFLESEEIYGILADMNFTYSDIQQCMHCT
ncbi:mannose-6-phosphate receptor domain-containing protein [Reticulomyxa filosa]|uniref:Mannose-6-phosphate receptor domain-containing protein n=1 Tax=Reticulomyxa filosa TaxID=46433 RepID=X6M6L4_RETFI|nr:mannose-6-phosphate receptor domain-containing protein [Reticulomyxa filosa]|eukprot:ETO09102.1 mannose-6-phosphate receptor domain-containing protein [Reticulomyxa filosa]